ncbi:hypothetical protein GCM10025862_13830 [Arsenicicoccus piscis]|uniref:RapZ-like N-terminal domain-containing protein n=1 Tax=Arsenicicoccus piscis TaxID=673954 RepID=A0ABQ6HM01_9MICO|nr:hypothetical protein GCM10025862_13830 [Arsenicicoccus piscis]
MDQPTAELTPLGPGHDFVIVTGMSGAGRSVCANVLEDSGWYVTDNLPRRCCTRSAR